MVHERQYMNKYQLLKTYFGYDEFREGQEELIDSILEGKDTFGIMPTGAGKSVCYQIPALMLPGITIVISPLISLMKDQVGALNQMGIHAAYLNSSLTSNQYLKALENARSGQYKLIYVAPERLLTSEFTKFALETEISMISIDEVHCVSQWGQDFRPSYLKIVEFIAQLPKKPIVSAFTATATKEVKEDVVTILGLNNPTIVSTGFDRKNLFFSVKNTKDKYRDLIAYLKENKEKSGIVYCSTRKNVEDVCEWLGEAGYPVTRYHAGLLDEERKQNQDDFIFDRKPIMVATNAFGMGIDKSNVRFVVHYNMPKNIESYYQEAGRAGRDGEYAECLLFYSGQDVITNQFFIENSGENEEKDTEMLEIVKERDRERLKKMTYYCFTKDCLRDYMLRYFGEYKETECGNCSNCLTDYETIDVTRIAKNILACVDENEQKYGTVVIVDAVHGSQSSKIMQLHLNRTMFYATERDVTVTRLREVVNHMLVEGFLQLSNDKFAVLKFTDKSKEVMDDFITIEMKVVKKKVAVKKNDEKTQEDGKTSTRVTRKKQEPCAETATALFEKLRELRAEIAREEDVPPYIIFADKTLLQMCRYRATTKAEMLNISGIGEVKYDKYGERFVGVIMKALNEN